MSLIATGRQQRQMANRGFGAVAKIEAEEEALRRQLSAAEKQAETQTLGTAAGLGGSYGIKQSLDAADAADKSISALNDSIGGGVGRSGGELTLQTSEGVYSGAEATEMIGAMETAAAETAALTEAGAGVEAATAAAATGETAAATGLTEAAAAGAAQTGPMATLSTIAAPIAIGLGVAFLLNKLF